MNADPDAVVADGVARVHDLLLQAQAAAETVIGRYADQVDAVRREVLELTGVEIVPEAPTRVPAVMDVPLGSLAATAEQCRLLLAAVQLIEEHVQPGSARTVGALLKTSVDPRTGALALDYLNRSGFYASDDDEGAASHG